MMKKNRRCLIKGGYCKCRGVENKRKVCTVRPATQVKCQRTVSDMESKTTAAGIVDASSSPIPSLIGATATRYESCAGRCTSMAWASEPSNESPRFTTRRLSGGSSRPTSTGKRFKLRRKVQKSRSIPRWAKSMSCKPLSGQKKQEMAVDSGRPLQRGDTRLDTRRPQRSNLRATVGKNQSLGVLLLGQRRMEGLRPVSAG